MPEVPEVTRKREVRVHTIIRRADGTIRKEWDEPLNPGEREHGDTD
jgi:hypothetical protein